MTSANVAINALHAAYCSAMAIELELSISTERQWCQALRDGVTADDVRLVLHDRRQRIREGVRHRESLYLRNLIGDDERIADLLNEAAVIRSLMRIPKHDPEKISVLKATGRAVQEVVTVHHPSPEKMSELFEKLRQSL